jgi:hypothetical protein
MHSRTSRDILNEVGAWQSKSSLRYLGRQSKVGRAYRYARTQPAFSFRPTKEGAKAHRGKRGNDVATGKSRIILGFRFGVDQFGDTSIT